MKRGVAIALAAFLVSGCTTMSLEELRRTEFQGNDFQKALARHYLNFANEEVAQYDWWSQMHFADKGLMVAYGKDVAPENPDDWAVPAHAQSSVYKAHDALVAVLTPEVMKASPQNAADAQYYFDCWIEQQQENWQDDDIARCRDGFAVAMQKLAGTYKEEMPEAAEPPPIPAALPAPKMTKEQDVIAYVVFFEWNTSEMSAQGKKVTDKVIKLLKDMDKYEVILNGHSDTAESKKNDFDLSQRRADAVRQRLVENGIDNEVIKTFAFGSSDPHVKTANNIKEPANRRVEIFLND